jgi:FkbM family methyltransferase
MTADDNALHRLVRRAANSIGRRLGDPDAVAAQMAALLRHFEIDVVLDVGANAGQYGLSLRKGGYTGRIVSFEPLEAAHARLSDRATRDSAWIVHPRSAVGSSSGQIEINVAGNSVSSSVRPMLAAHSEAAPESQFVATERVDLITLDSVYGQYCPPPSRALLKIDTQGFEKEVLDGAVQASRSLRAVQLELSLVPLYEGQHLWDYFMERLRQEGFGLWAFLPGFADPRTGQTLQVDAVFARP